MALYGAPVWSHRLTCARRCKTKILNLQQRVAIHMVRGYRTISWRTTQGGDPSGVLSAVGHLGGEGHEGLRPDSRPSSKWRKSSEGLSRRLRGDRYAHKRVVSAILPAFEAWMRRKRRVTFRLTQVLTGHGCSGEYLCKIGREATAVQEIGRNLSLRAVVSAMLRRESAWEVVVSFCETVMVQKEIAERARERADPAWRRRPTGRPPGLQAPLPGAE
ncbi:uncharacterized protein LOC135194320 [Vanessa tameamea]|uniref:Uncharacterized protein LOC135194320 n=1 Tax=Vanessa tameamea TaxID=334116 RepID=A0ABM4AWN0_VANTA